MNLQDRVAVITGAGSGIGRATAFAMARRGARLALADIDGAAVAAVALLERLSPVGYWNLLKKAIKR